MKTPKEFALEAIAPYFKNHYLCANNGFSCKYLLDDGRKCVAGKYMTDDSIKRYNNISSGSAIGRILNDASQESVFIPEVIGILTNDQWNLLQQIHDLIAFKSFSLREKVAELDLFTYEELEAYAR